MSPVIYHNPECGTSRNVLKILQSHGDKPTVVEYLQTGWTRAQLLGLFAAAGLTPRDALRISKSPAQELGLTRPEVTDEELLVAMVEHPVLVDLAQRGIVDIVGLNYKDEPDSAKQWLRALGDPYVSVPVDTDGRIGIDWGFYGAPETFVVDKEGIVRHKHIGPVSPADLQNTILPMIAELQAR